MRRNSRRFSCIVCLGFSSWAITITAAWAKNDLSDTVTPQTMRGMAQVSANVARERAEAAKKIELDGGGEAQLAAEWNSLFRSNEAGWERAQFVKQKDATFHIVDPEQEGMKGDYAMLFRNVVLVNEKALKQDWDILRGPGWGKDALVHLLALKTFNLMAHEIRHGITNEGFSAAVGLPKGVDSVEDETLSYMDQLDALCSSIKNHPEILQRAMLMDMQIDQLLAASQDGVRSVRQYVRRLQPDIPSFISMSPDERAKLFMTTAEHNVSSEMDKKRVLALKEKLLLSEKDPGKIKAIGEVADRMVANADVLKERSAASMELLKDDAKLKAAQDFYKKKLDAAQLNWADSIRDLEQCRASWNGSPVKRMTDEARSYMKTHPSPKR